MDSKQIASNSQNTFHLITTACMESWRSPGSQPLLLGEWCLPSSFEAFWRNKAFTVVPPYGSGRHHEESDTALARAIEPILMEGVSSLLNDTHDEQHSQRYWKIIVANWLRRFITIFLNRMWTLESAFAQFPITSTAVYEVDQYTLATLDSKDFVQAANNEIWNHVVFAKLCILLKLVPETVVALGPPPQRQFSPPHERQPYLKRCHRKLAEFISKKLAKRHKVFVLNSYLPKRTVVALHLALGQSPQIWAATRPKITKQIDKKRRCALAFAHAATLQEPLHKMMVHLLWDMLPVSFLEAYGEIKIQGEKLGWPKQPDVIFTSNNYDYDDVFKIWAAGHIEQGSRYLIGQHGANYGTHRYQNPFIEETICDCFFTWGWDGNGATGYERGFVLKYPSKGILRYSPQGRILFVQLLSAYQIYLHDAIGSFPAYFREQKKLIDDLSSKLRNQITVRLPGGVHSSARNEHALWTEYAPDLELEIATGPIDAAISKSRLVIFAYDSTGLLETLSQNIPTLAFWQNGLDHLRDEAQSDYQRLVDAGILWFSGAQLAAHLNQIEDDIEGWWQSSHVQDAVSYFCSRYARTTSDPIAMLVPVIKKLQVQARNEKQCTPQKLSL